MSNDRCAKKFSEEDKAELMEMGLKIQGYRLPPFLIPLILYSCFKNVKHFLLPGTTASRRCSTPLARRVSRVRSTLSSRYFHRNTLLSEKHLVDLHKLLQQHMLDGDVSSRGFKIFYSNKNLWWMSG